MHIWDVLLTRHHILGGMKTLLSIFNQTLKRFIFIFALIRSTHENIYNFIATQKVYFNFLLD